MRTLRLELAAGFLREEEGTAVAGEGRTRTAVRRKNQSSILDGLGL